jgi:hypothetical protein
MPSRFIRAKRVLGMPAEDLCCPAPALTSGVGGGAQSAIGTSVLGGMVTAPILVVVFSPLFYVLIEKLLGKKMKPETSDVTLENPCDI